MSRPPSSMVMTCRPGPGRSISIGVPVVGGLPFIGNSVGDPPTRRGPPGDARAATGGAHACPVFGCPSCFAFHRHPGGSMVGLVLVSHSARLVEGLREMVAQVAGDDVPVATAGGTEDGRIGTSAALIADAIRTTLGNGADATLVLVDLGSAVLSLELALDELEPDDRARVRISDAPLVEGAVVAAVQASVGADVDEVAEAALGARAMAKAAS